MTWKLARYAKWAAKLLMTEMLVPGGTLIVLALLLAGGSSPAIRRRLTAYLADEEGEASGSWERSDDILRPAEAAMSQ